MTQPCIVYAIATILLSWTDAMRFKYQWGKVANINHAVSRGLAAGAAGAVGMWWAWHNHIPLTWWLAIAIILMVASFIGIRIALFDIFLNLFRRWTGTNPTGRIDYVSTTTSSYEDQHSEKVGFWAKRVAGFIGWLLMFLLYKVIFKV